MKLKIGIFGAANGHIPEATFFLAEALGEAVALKDAILITGATTGLPAAAARGAKKQGGVVIGISPAENREEHEHLLNLPVYDLDAIIYSGFGWEGRNVLNVRTADIALFIGGSAGTLGEFTIAYNSEKVIGLLRGSGGITDQIPGLLDSFFSKRKAVLIQENDPEKLVAECLAVYNKQLRKNL